MDTSSPLPLLRALLPKTPLILRTALLHTLSLTPTAATWDLRTELTIKILRSFLETPNPNPLGKVQRLTLKDPGVKGRMWVSRVTLKVPDPEQGPGEGAEDVGRALKRAFNGLRDSDDQRYLVDPDVVDVEAEWTGYRSGVGPNEPEPRISEEAKYERLMGEVSSDVVILYFHGGALLDPASHRPSTSLLAHLTKGRTLSVRYRLAPQHPFPAALLDCLVAYLSLLYPPPGSPHKPVKASSIVFAGDSAGGALSFALLQLILELHQQEASKHGTPVPGSNGDAVRLPSVRWHDAQMVDIPLPAGVSANSGWFDITRSLPSLTNNAAFDYLPPPPPSQSTSTSTSATPSTPPSPPRKSIPHDPIWPPPAHLHRTDIYADDKCLTHPLVSPLATSPQNWRGSPPLHFITGTELLTDEDETLAAFAASQDVSVRFERYATMPHCFALLLRHLPESRVCMKNWAGFIVDCVERSDGGGDGGETMRTKGVSIAPRSLEMTDVDVRTLGNGRTIEDVRRGMRISVEKGFVGMPPERGGKDGAVVPVAKL
ncbi:MAG: hypothetical protein M1817_000004 [Caeruleum heppii]|nr:MAG: hypothetical protein M1817_000004 [Caeruleum heppii]